MQTTALNNWVNLLSKFAYTNLYTKGPFFQVVVLVVRHNINPFNIKAVMLDHQCCIENAHLRRLVWVFVARCKYQNIMKFHVRIQVRTPPPWKITKYKVSSNTCLDPLKNRSCEASIQCWAFIGMPAKHHLMAFRWRVDDGPLKVRLGSSLPSSTLKINVVKIEAPLTKLSGSAHELCPTTV